MEKLKSLLFSTQKELEESSEDLTEKIKNEAAKAREAIQKNSELELLVSKMKGEISEERETKTFALAEVEGIPN